jgi:hypothetical protein
MVMITQSRFARFRATARTCTATSEPPSDRNLGGRLIQIALAIYLLPALLVVLVVGAVGMLVIAVGRLFAGPFGQSTGQGEQSDPADDDDVMPPATRQSTWR